ncbi:hypothetical protein A0H81_11306 [Grifola frondosa]|uniref:Uncharacterized protein n=1 Tax=Grifola frondosa TaxID=5627 RepID=A0A1C7LVN1_GRIFR|nr:hypothetical protein A0H81_11306 [Grifola frondosa]
MLEDGMDDRSTPAVRRKDVPVAFEVSDDWIALEEQKARAMVFADPTLEDQNFRVMRDKEFRSRKNTIRARKGQARTSLNERDREGEKLRRKEFDEWLARKEVEWKSAEIWRALDSVALNVLDRVLKEGEERQDESQVDEHPMQGNMPAGAMVGEEELGVAQPQDIPTSEIDEDMIDPALRELSRATSMASAVSLESHTILGSTQGPPLPTLSVNVPAQPPSLGHLQPTTPPFHNTPLPPDAVPSLTNASLAAQALYAQSEGSIPSNEDPATMSPASRRRYRKRLYMRRKRAEALGGVVDENAIKLKPGRKPKKVPVKSKHTDDDKPTLSRAESLARDNEPSTSRPADHTESGSSSDDGEHRHAHLSGLTRPYKLRAEFGALGIDAAKLRHEGLGLFHLGGLAKLMQMYNMLHDVSPAVSSQVSAETIRLLDVHVVNFVTQAVHRIVVSREQERMAKLHTKVWRVAKNRVISAAHVEHALSLFGDGKLTKKAHFKGLFKRLDLDVSDESDGEDDRTVLANAKRPVRHTKQRKQRKTKTPLHPDGSGSQSSSEDADDESGDGDQSGDEATPVSMPRLSLHRTVFTPFIRLPGSYAAASNGRYNPVDLTLCMPWPPTNHTSTEPVIEDELIPEELDADALLKELLDEEKLDKRDSAIAGAYEKGLWEKFPRASAAPSDLPGTAIHDNGTILPAPSNGQGIRLRKRRRREIGSDDDEAGRAVRRRRGAKDDTRHDTSDLRFCKPDLRSRVKSQVYIVDSD